MRGLLLTGGQEDKKNSCFRSSWPPVKCTGPRITSALLKHPHAASHEALFRRNTLFPGYFGRFISGAGMLHGTNKKTS